MIRRTLENIALRRQQRSEKPYYKWLVLGTAVFALLIILLDVTVVNVATPQIIRDFHASLAQIQWAFNSYTIAFAALLITFGRLGDMYGHKTLFVLGLVTFGISSALSGASPSVDWLIFYRTLQGIGGAMMMPATLSLTLTAFPPHQRGLALGLWGATAGLALAIGPTLGGYIVDHYSWRWIFYINIPVALIALALTFTFIHQSKEFLTSHKIDWWGFITVTGGLVALTFALIEGQKYGWTSAFILSCFGAAIILFMAFIYNERRVEEPMVDLTLFRDRNFTIGNLLAALITFSMLGTFFIVPIYLQQILGFTAVQTGLALTPLSIVMLIVAPNVGRLVDRFGGKWFMFGGMAIVSVALFWLSHFTPTISRTALILPFALYGLGLACVMPVMTIVALAKVPPHQYGAGSGVLNTARQVGGVLGVTIVGVFFTAQLSHNVPPAVRAQADIPQQTKNQVVSQFSGGEVQVNRDDSSQAAAQAQIQSLPPAARPAAEAQVQKIQGEVKSAIEDSVTKSVNDTFRFAIIFTALGALTALFINNKKSERA